MLQEEEKQPLVGVRDQWHDPLPFAQAATRAVVLDTETTGVEDPGLVQSAWAEVDHLGRPGREGQVQLWNPGKPISYGAMATHHITDAEVADEPPAAGFRLPEGTTHLIGHNVDFDWKVIGEPDVKRICTLALARRMWPDMDSHSLGACIYRVMPAAEAREVLRSAHNAWADVLMCAEVLRAICAAFGPKDLDDLWRMSEEARVPTHLNFGKHKGVAIADVPRDYKAWLLRQPDLDPYLVKALRA